MGFRYEYDRARILRRHLFDAHADGIRFPVAPLVKLEEDYHAFLPEGSVSYRVSPEMMAFARISRGYRPGGFIFASDDPRLAGYDSEFTWNYELGLKSTMLQQRVQFDASLFFLDVENFMVRRQTGLNFVLLNAKRAHSVGAEVQLSARPIKGLEITAGMAFTDARFDEFSDPFSGRNFDGNRINLSRPYDLFLSAQYKHSNGFFVRGEFQGVGPYPFLEDNERGQGAYELFNARLGWEHGPLRISIYGKNLLNRTYYHFGVSDLSGTDLLTTPGVPQTFGVNAAIRF